MNLSGFLKSRLRSRGSTAYPCGLTSLVFRLRPERVARCRQLAARDKRHSGYVVCYGLVSGNRDDARALSLGLRPRAVARPDGTRRRHRDRRDSPYPFGGLAPCGLSRRTRALNFASRLPDRQPFSFAMLGFGAMVIANMGGYSTTVAVFSFLVVRQSARGGVQSFSRLSFGRRSYPARLSSGNAAAT